MDVSPYPDNIFLPVFTFRMGNVYAISQITIFSPWLNHVRCFIKATYDNEFIHLIKVHYQMIDLLVKQVFELVEEVVELEEPYYPLGAV